MIRNRRDENKSPCSRFIIAREVNPTMARAEITLSISSSCTPFPLALLLLIVDDLQTRISWAHQEKPFYQTTTASQQTNNKTIERNKTKKKKKRIR